MCSKTLTLLLFFVVAVLSACAVERSPGCSTDLDCKVGRVCVDSVCAYPGGSVGGTVLPRDSGSPDGRDATEIPSEPRIRLEPDTVWFGSIPPRQTAAAVVQVFNSGGGTLEISDVWVTDEVFSVRELNAHSITSDDPPVLIEIVALVPYDVDGVLTVNGALYVESNAVNGPEGAVPLGIEVRAEP